MDVQEEDELRIIIQGIQVEVYGEEEMEMRAWAENIVVKSEEEEEVVGA